MRLLILPYHGVALLAGQGGPAHWPEDARPSRPDSNAGGPFSAECGDAVRARRYAHHVRRHRHRAVNILRSRRIGNPDLQDQACCRSKIHQRVQRKFTELPPNQIVEPGTGDAQPRSCRLLRHVPRPHARLQRRKQLGSRLIFAASAGVSASTSNTVSNVWTSIFSPSILAAGVPPARCPSAPSAAFSSGRHAAPAPVPAAWMDRNRYKRARECCRTARLPES